MSFNSSIRSTALPEHRGVERVPTNLKAIVQVKESEAASWKEVTKVNTVSRNGAGFMLSKSCAVGRLVNLVMPLAVELRAYDEKEELYPVMGIVQYCNESTVEGRKVFHVGVGFIGKKVPESFKANPGQSYRINGMAKNGLWKITEAESQFTNRKQPRYWLSLGVTISLIQKDEKTIAKEETFTKNIGSGGVSVASTLAASVGDKVKFACKALDFYAMAVVRNCKTPKEDKPTLHLEFIEDKFPIEKLLQAQLASAA